MADLNDIAVFVKVAQLGSFSRAAHALGMPVSTVSRKVSALESELGVTLLQRTTRKLALTSQGRDYFHQCSEPLNLLFDAERVLTQTQRKPEGLLKISVPVVLGQDPFLGFISDFLKVYPSIKIDLFITNVFLDLIAENVDVAIRFGQLRELDADCQEDWQPGPLCRRLPRIFEGSQTSNQTQRPQAASVCLAQWQEQRSRVGIAKWTQTRRNSRLGPHFEPRFPISQYIRL